MGWYDRKVRRVRDLSCGDTRIFLELEVRRVECRRCGTVKRERLDFLADNPLYTSALPIMSAGAAGRRRSRMSAEELKLDWHTVKTLDQQYMEAQLQRAGTPSPRVIGIDEIAIRKGHTYRIVVSDLLRGRPIWFGGKDRAEASMSEFYAWLGKRKNSRIRLAVMDMWKPFRLATAAHAPQVRDFVRQVPRHAAFRRGSGSRSQERIWATCGRDRRYIKGRKYTLLSRKENLTLDGGKGFEGAAVGQQAAQHGLCPQGELRSTLELRTRRLGTPLLENWRASLKWQRLKPYEKFAEMIQRHWDGIAAYCRLENKVSLGFVEGLNNKIRVIQRRAYGLRNEEYLRLKILTYMLPALSLRRRTPSDLRLSC